MGFQISWRAVFIVDRDGCTKYVGALIPDYVSENCQHSLMSGIILLRDVNRLRYRRDRVNSVLRLLFKYRISCISGGVACYDGLLFWVKGN